MKISIASGKGGTGKTTVATNLFLLAKEKNVTHLSLYDCDVEAPNDNLFLKYSFDSKDIVKTFIPTIIEEHCTACGICVDACNFNSLALIKKTKKIVVFSDICHSCKACQVLCPTSAIAAQYKIIGEICTYKTNKIKFISGQLKSKEILSPVIIKQMKKKISKNEFAIIDSPPGTSCAVVNSIYDSDLCILVTEPTPFGLYDLNLAVELLKKLNIPCYVVINKAQPGNHCIEKYCIEENIKIIGKIPFDINIAKQYSNGKNLLDLPVVRKELEKIFEIIIKN